MILSPRPENQFSINSLLKSPRCPECQNSVRDFFRSTFIDQAMSPLVLAQGGGARDFKDWCHASPIGLRNLGEADELEDGAGVGGGLIPTWMGNAKQDWRIGHCQKIVTF